MGLRFGFGWMITAAFAALVGCGGEQAPAGVDQEVYDDVISTTESSGLYEQCVYGPGYWAQNNKYASDPARAIAWPRDAWTPNRDTEDRLLCGRSFHSILTSPWDGTPWHALAQPWVAAYINVKNGAGGNGTAVNAFQQGLFLLSTCNITSAEPARTHMLTLKTWLAGGHGPAACAW